MAPRNEHLKSFVRGKSGIECSERFPFVEASAHNIGLLKVRIERNKVFFGLAISQLCKLK